MTELGTAERLRHIAQGEYALGFLPTDVISTILGSCVAACIWDPAVGLGGMNHILLPDRTENGRVLEGFGASAMEQLINALLKAGATRSRLRAKVFGGANMISGLSDIGARNGEFILGYLKREGIPVDGQSLGGTRARQVRFWPHTGSAKQRLVAPVDLPPPPPVPVPKANDVELF